MHIMNMKVKGKCSLSLSTDNNDSTILVPYVGPSKDGYNSIFGYFNKENDIKDLYSNDFININFINGKNYNLFNGVKKGHNIMNSIFSNNGIPLFPFYSYNGYENYFILIPNKASYENILSSAGKENKIISSEYINVNSEDNIFDLSKRLTPLLQLSNITEIEKKILKDALNNGYFSWPRNYSLTNISNEFNLSKPTILFHLRNAEKKILSALIK